MNFIRQTIIHGNLGNKEKDNIVYLEGTRENFIKVMLSIKEPNI